MLKLCLPGFVNTVGSIVEGASAPPIIDGIERGHEPFGLPPILRVEQVGLCLTSRDQACEDNYRFLASPQGLYHALSGDLAA